MRSNRRNGGLLWAWCDVKIRKENITKIIKTKTKKNEKINKLK